MEIAWLIFVLALGLCVGSFLNVVVYRLPRGQSIVFPGSRCPQCGRAIRWYDNIPILSWLALRGRCRFCKGPISPRYLVVEALTGLLVAGLYAWYFLLKMRSGAAAFADSWPMFLAHAALLCTLLACSIVDIEMWIVPLEVCWFVSVLGVVCSGAAPHPYMPPISATTGAMAVGAVVGLAVAIVLVRIGLIQPSFLDADDRAQEEPAESAGPDKNKKDVGRKAERITSAAIGKEHGVNPRLEILRELLFLAPAILLAIGARALVTHWAPASRAWQSLTDEAVGGAVARHANGALAALFGYLIGGLWIWGVRIAGTLGFGKEAMGLGDVHIMGAVGAVTGWIVPSLAFFIAPFFALLWAVHLWLSRRQRELPYGPWLAVASLVVMLFQDPIARWLAPHTEALSVLWKG